MLFPISIISYFSNVLTYMPSSNTYAVDLIANPPPDDLYIDFQKFLETTGLFRGFLATVSILWFSVADDVIYAGWYEEDSPRKPILCSDTFLTSEQHNPALGCYILPKGLFEQLKETMFRH